MSGRVRRLGRRQHRKGLPRPRREEVLTIEPRHHAPCPSKPHPPPGARRPAQRPRARRAAGGAVRRRPGRSSSSGRTRARRARASTCRASTRRPARLSTPTLAAEIRNPSFLAASADGRFLYAVSEVDARRRQAGRCGRRLRHRQGGRDAQAAEHAVDGRRRSVPRQRRRHGWCSRPTTAAAASPPIRPQDDGSLKPAVDLRPAQGLERQPGSAEGAARARRHARPVGAVPLRARPRPRSGARLPHRRRGRDDRAGDAAVRRDHAGRLRSAPHRDLPRRPARLRDHRDVLHDRRCSIATPTTGALSPVQTISTLPAGQAVEKGFSTAEVLLHPSGQASSTARTAATTASWSTPSIASSGKLTLRPARADGRQDAARLQHRSDRRRSSSSATRTAITVVVFRIDPAKGTLTATGHTVSVGKPVSFEFVR